MEKEHTCKCTTPWILGIVIGIAIATVSCLVYFLVLNDSCVNGDCLGLVVRRAPSPTTNTSIAEKTTVPQVNFPEKKGTYFLPASMDDDHDVNDAVGLDELINDCTNNCVNGSEQCTYVDEFGNGAIASGQSECEECCDQLVNESSLYQFCQDFGGAPGSACEEGPEISGCETWRCMDCETGAIYYVDIDDCWPEW